MGTVNALEARTHFSDLLHRVARGEKITIAGYGAHFALPVPVERKESKLTRSGIARGMRELRKRVKPGNVSLREMIAEGRRYRMAL
jgi:antitoxin (DNA-binding transcriptional repressor) of toxin-antitoxin stability system